LIVRDILAVYLADNQGGTVAQRVVLTDDLDGSKATQTLNYTVDGQEYGIDLSEENIQRFHEALDLCKYKSRRMGRYEDSQRGTVEFRIRSR
jgi:Lsr2